MRYCLNKRHLISHQLYLKVSILCCSFHEAFLLILYQGLRDPSLRFSSLNRICILKHGLPAALLLDTQAGRTSCRRGEDSQWRREPEEWRTGEIVEGREARLEGIGRRGRRRGSEWTEENCEGKNYRREGETEDREKDKR